MWYVSSLLGKYIYIALGFQGHSSSPNCLSQLNLFVGTSLLSSRCAALSPSSPPSTLGARLPLVPLLLPLPLQERLAPRQHRCVCASLGGPCALGRRRPMPQESGGVDAGHRGGGGARPDPAQVGCIHAEVG